MSKKIIIFVIIAIVVIGVAIYFTLIKEPSPTPEGAYIASEEEIIKVLFPTGGEKLEIGKTYAIRWENHIGNEPLTIALQVRTPDGKAYAKWIDHNIPAVAEGIYNWTVTSELTDSKYRIDIYGDRQLGAQSKDFFSITGDSLIIINTPQSLEEVASPIKIIGKARQIFSEGEFIIRLREVGAEWDEDKSIFVKFPAVAETIAWAKTGDWMSGDWCDFAAELSFTSEQLAWDEGATGSVMIEFYQRDERFGGENLIYEFPVSTRK